MREMVFDILGRTAKVISGKCLGEELWNLSPLAAIPEAAEHQSDFGRMERKIGDLAPAVSAAVLIDRNMMHIGQAKPCFVQAIGDRLRGKPGPMLDPAKPLLFGGCHQFAVPYQRGRRIPMEGINAKNDHREVI